MNNPQEYIKAWSQKKARTNRVLFVKMLDELNWNDEEIAAILLLIDKTCEHCRDSLHPCYCSRDE